MTHRIAYIYALTADDGRVRYIGKTVNPAGRIANHRNCSKPKSYVGRWINGVRREGQSVQMSILESCPESAWEDRERRWISHGRSLGWSLTNTDAGGVVERHRVQHLSPGTSAHDRKQRADAKRMRKAEVQRKRIDMDRRCVRMNLARHLRSLIDPVNRTRLARARRHIDRVGTRRINWLIAQSFGKTQTSTPVK